MKNSALPNTIEQLFAAAFGGELSLTEALYRHMALPDTAFLGTRITKKMLNDSASHNGIVLTTQEKQLISESVQSIEWRYTAKFAQRAKNVKLAIFLYRANIIGCLDPCQCIDQRCAFYTKVTTYSGFGHASFQRF